MSNSLIEQSKATSPTHSTCSSTSNGAPEHDLSPRFWRSSDTTPTPTATNSNNSLSGGSNNENANTTSSHALGAYHSVNRGPFLPVRGHTPHRLTPKLPCRTLISAAGYDARRRPRLGSRARQVQRCRHRRVTIRHRSTLPAHLGHRWLLGRALPPSVQHASADTPLGPCRIPTQWCLSDLGHDR